MTKFNAICGGCLSGMIALVLGTMLVTYGYGFLTGGYFDYEELLRVPSPSAKNYAHLFINTHKRDHRTPYIGICVTSDKYLSRDYESEVFTISPTNALVDLIWIGDNTLEIKYYINPALDARVSWGTPFSEKTFDFIFTEVHCNPSSKNSFETTMERKP